ncbi:hypothetical protein UFOVP665_19 [uncultured Caudovirales phage]|uniref:Uncharacterized protein n=1 Tax=uncultured Caudovirales phage TaxID=2100421 RepID=A0A6J5NCJ0_9CAUD|nr:hypothetical protein UFOVP665_19 [uncultured Caudovirales phage]
MVYRLDQHGKQLTDENTVGVFDKQIDCKATQAAGGCPLFNDDTRPETGAVYGMFSTDCWYRGKYGNHLIENLGLDTNVLYGNDECHLDEQSCAEFADEIQVELDARIAEEGFVMINDEDHTDEVRYLVWWLNWCAKYGDGIGAWY